MATYAIGDVQGCYQPLQRLLKQINFDAAADRLWFTGDLVNRGPQSLDVLRFITDLPNPVVVLGNHDMHLLSVGMGLEPLKQKDTFTDVLNAPDRESLLTWLRFQPFFHQEEELGCSIVHAGVIPAWDFSDLKKHAQELASVLQGPDHIGFLRAMYGNYPDQWSEDLKGRERHRFMAHVFTRIRYCTQDGRLNLEAKGREAPLGYFPWFAVPKRRTQGQMILFGHWASIDGRTNREDALALDTGCVWGRSLTAYCLETGQYTRVHAEK